MGYTIGISIALMLGGAIFFDNLRTKVYGIIGVGGSFIATVGIMMLCSFIGMIYGDAQYNIVEIVLSIIFMIVGLLYLAYVMIFKCNTIALRIFMPIIVVMITLGFALRLFLLLFLKVPMSSGEPIKPKFPSSVVDDQGETWELQYDSGDHAEYQCRKTGARETFWMSGDSINIPYGWRAN